MMVYCGSSHGARRIRC